MISINTSLDLISMTLETLNFEARFYFAFIVYNVLLKEFIVSVERTNSEHLKLEFILQNHHIYLEFICS